MISVNVDMAQALKELRSFDDTLDKAMEVSLRKTAHESKRTLQKSLESNDHTVTYTGYNSLNNVRKVKKNHYRVLGARYLDELIKGQPPHEPEVHNRLRTWASMRGWNLQDIISHLRTEGSKPHPQWWNQSTNRISATAEKKTVNRIKRMLNR